jgi:hypothetical protein
MRLEPDAGDRNRLVPTCFRLRVGDLCPGCCRGSCGPFLEGIPSVPFGGADSRTPAYRFHPLNISIEKTTRCVNQPTPGNDEFYGHGFVNALRAVQ